MPNDIIDSLFEQLSAPMPPVIKRWHISGGNKASFVVANVEAYSAEEAEGKVKAGIPEELFLTCCNGRLSIREHKKNCKCVWKEKISWGI